VPIRREPTRPKTTEDAAQLRRADSGESRAPLRRTAAGVSIEGWATVENQGGRPPRFSQRQAAKQAGLSKDQEKQAVRVANVPDDDFDAAVESDDPPTVTELAARDSG
jgi:hypothetical protein